MSSCAIARQYAPSRIVLDIGTFLALIGLMALAASPADSAPEPMEIIRRVAEAKGSVTFRAIRHVHIIRNGQTVRTLKQKVLRADNHRERIETYGNGQSPVHVVVCDGRQMWEYWPSRQKALQHPAATIDQSSQSTEKCIQLLYRGMALDYQGRDTVASRPAHVIAIRNKKNELVRRTWVDTLTSVELRVEKFHGANRPYMRTVVTSIDYSSAIDEKQFRFNKPRGVSIKKIPAPPMRITLEQAEEWAGFDARIPENLPTGYVFERDSVGVTRYDGNRTLWLTFTNGLDTFSLFQSKCDRESKVRTKKGATLWASKGMCYMLMSHLSDNDVQKIINSTD